MLGRGVNCPEGVHSHVWKGCQLSCGSRFQCREGVSTVLRESIPMYERGVNCPEGIHSLHGNGFPQDS